MGDKSIFLMNTRLRNGCSWGETKYNELSVSVSVHNINLLTLHHSQQVNGQPHLQANTETGGWASNTIKQNAVDDTVDILFSTKSVAKDVAEALQNMQLNVGVMVSEKYSFLL